jgi:hypothetical protein
VFLDELQIKCIGGKGGDGLVHFAKRKYQAFGGPDGGDGGNGGAVVLRGQRDVDTLHPLRLHVRRYGPFKAPDGKPGGPNLMIGARAADLDLAVPLGTMAFDAATGEEIGAVLASDARLPLAQGGRSGRGNTKFATAQLQAPKKAEVGRSGDERKVDLLFRIYADTMLLEPLYSEELALLPQLTGRSVADLDFELYQRKPRWLRYQHDYLDYDIAFLPLLVGMALPPEETDYEELTELEALEVQEHPSGLPGSSQLAVPLLSHLYWARHAVVNLMPLGEGAAEIWDLLSARLLDVPLRRLERLRVLAPSVLFEPWALETEQGQAEVDCVAVDPAGGEQTVLEAFCAELTGGVVI